ncbi:helix-turn-helix domain-containing protein [Streptomyces noursei]
MHWVARANRYAPRRSHGPCFGATTIRLARWLARLSPCRPSVSYLARRLKVSERTVQYHLAILREAGLLAYVVRGTRRRGAPPLASEFARVIPAEFDHALGIRTTGEGPMRRMTGIAERGRTEIARLARAAATRRRCTPKKVSPVLSSPSGDTSLPPETTVVSDTGIRQRVNRVGRRHQLARELVREVGWLARTPVPRVAWVLRHLADAGWTTSEVHAWLHLRGGTGQRVHRPSGLLATLVAGAESTLDTPAKRAAAVDDWRDARLRTRQRPQQWASAWQSPRSPAVLRVLTPALSQSTRPDATLENPTPEHLTADEVQTLRETANGEFMTGETTLITAAVDAWGLPMTQRVYGAGLVARALQLIGATALMSAGTARDGMR